MWQLVSAISQSNSKQDMRILKSRPPVEYLLSLLFGVAVKKTGYALTNLKAKLIVYWTVVRLKDESKATDINDYIVFHNCYNLFLELMNCFFLSS